MYINIRGTNGSGKTSLLRQFFKQATEKVMLEVPDHRPIPLTILGNFAVLGDYTPTATGTTAGCDKIKTQAAAKYALEQAHRFMVETRFLTDGPFIFFEGVVISTIYGPWADWGRGKKLIWAFLDTPLDECLRRVQVRNGGKPVQDDQIAAKHKTIQRVQAKAQDDGLSVVSLRWERALSDLRDVIQ